MIQIPNQLKLLLLIIALGIWGLLIRSFFPAPSTSASAAPVPAKHLHVVSENEQGKIVYDHTGERMTFSSVGLVQILNDAARKNIKVHSVISVIAQISTFREHYYYIVFVER